MHTRWGQILLFLKICMPQGHNSCEITWNRYGKNFNPLNFLYYQISLKVCKFSKTWKKKFFGKKFKKNVIIILILTQNNQLTAFSSLSHFSGVFKTIIFAIFYDFLKSCGGNINFTRISAIFTFHPLTVDFS